MTGTPRLVATDLDGTLLGSEGRVSARTRGVLDELDAAGVPVVFTTGRPIRWMEELWEAVGGHGLAICSNGGIVYDVARREVRTARAIPAEVLLEVATMLRREVPGTVFALEKTTGFAKEPDFMPRLAVNLSADVPTAPLEDLVDGDVVKLLARHEDHEPEPYWERVAAALGEQVVTTWSSTGTLVEISAAGVTKATTLATVASEMGLGPEDVVAFGDMPNDLPMLEWAGTSYAMANAHPSVRELADHLAPHHDEDGVATVLADLFGLSVDLPR
ncbi:hydrolase [Nocardioides flavus (ex Wang et al. 2016)]|uniref:Hydrolase n=1 Tax=Nocardioides flavus (ex Wang et al. 2016) TaxID=2058780 RepID=A0ABQ3HJN0_9ACTN|nr:HAD family hydrolase [Nocardioides flavus (ex Wang et al. 2016)]GHE16000.1 hydrolase [Nocardioides flavus (ex Wang et al. 2016)]